MIDSLVPLVPEPVHETHLAGHGILLPTIKNSIRPLTSPWPVSFDEWSSGLSGVTEHAARSNIANAESKISIRVQLHPSTTIPMANEVKTMGSRLGVIVKTIDGWDIRYDHWSAQTLGRDIALDGYEATLTRIRQMAPYGVDTPQEMKSAPWLEGTLFIDMITKRNRLGRRKRRLLPSPAHQRPDRTDMARMDRNLVPRRHTRHITRHRSRHGHHLHRSFVQRPRRLRRRIGYGPMDHIQRNRRILLHNRKQQNNHLGKLHRPRKHSPTRPNKMHTLVNKVIQGCNEGKPWQWNLQTHNKQPEKGIHIDYINKTIKWWSIYEDDWAINPFNALWPGWTLHSKGDNYEWHENITGYKMRDWKQDVTQCKNTLTQTIKQGIRTNPIERLTGALAKQGVDMRIRPATFQFVPSRMEQPPERIFAYLDRLESDEPLSPARFINRDGEIIPACQ